jgi:hypothetical protein
MIIINTAKITFTAETEIFRQRNLTFVKQTGGYLGLTCCLIILSDEIFFYHF